MSCRQALNACLICRFYNRCYSSPSYDGFIVSRIKMATKLSTKVGLCTHFSVSGNWMKQCVSCLKYYFTLSLPFEQRLVFRLRCEVQNVVSIIISTQYRFFLRFFFWHLVINGQFMLIVQIPGLGRLWFDSLLQMSSLAIRDMVLWTLLFNLPWKLSTVFDRSIVTKRLSQVLTWVWPKSYTNCFSTIFSYIFLCFFPCISVVRCCCESSFMKITCHVTFAF